MDLYITQNSYYFVHRHFQKFFLKDSSHVIYVREKKRGLFKKYYEILKNLGLINTVLSVKFECIYFLFLFRNKSRFSTETIDDSELNSVLEERIKNRKYKRVFSIGCPSMIDSNLQKKYGVDIYNLHGGIIPFQRGRFSPVKSLRKGHNYLGSSLYLISGNFDDGPLVSQDYFKITNKNVLVNYNKVLQNSSELLEAFFSSEIKLLPALVFKDLEKSNL